MGPRNNAHFPHLGGLSASACALVTLLAAPLGCSGSSDTPARTTSTGGTTAGAGGATATGGAVEGSGAAGGAIASGGSPGTGGVGGKSGAGGQAPADAGAGGAPPAEGGAVPEDVPACEGTLYAVPEDPALRGPWPVGVKTVSVSGLTTEIWYPARIGSEAGAERASYDIRLALPPSEQSKIPDSDNPVQPCDCFRNLPLDDGHGPYPVVAFVHGTAAFRTQSLAQMEHWASRGFVVVSSDHPHLWLADYLTFNIVGADPPGNVRKVLEALRAPAGELAFLANHLNLGRIGLVGHSAGGNAVSSVSGTAGARVVIPMAAGGVAQSSSLESSLVMGAADDKVVPYSGQVNGYGTTPSKKRLVGIANAGHLVFSDLCALSNAEGQDLVQIAQEHQVANANLAGLLWDGCADAQIDPRLGMSITSYATTAVLEETLRCDPRAAAKLTQIRSRFPEVSEYREAL